MRFVVTLAVLVAAVLSLAPPSGAQDRFLTMEEVYLGLGLRHLVTGKTTCVVDPNTGKPCRELTPDESSIYGSGASELDVKASFRRDSAQLTTLGARNLDTFIEAVRAAPDAFEGKRFRVAGYNKATGDMGYDRRISETRARSVANYLISNGQFDREQFSIIGRGSELATGVSGGGDLRIMISLLN